MVAILGLLGSFADSLIRALAEKFWEMYIAAVAGFMGGINSPMLQAVLAGLVDRTEIGKTSFYSLLIKRKIYKKKILGKVYAVISSLQTLSPLASAPVYTGIYNSTLVSYPGAFYFLSSALYFANFLLIT